MTEGLGTARVDGLGVDLRRTDGGAAVHLRALRRGGRRGRPIKSHIPEIGPEIERGVIVALGASVGFGDRSPRQTLGAALASLSSEGFTLVKRSRWWRSAAWPDVQQAPFVNAAAWVTTPCSPEDALQRLHAIESRFGRRRGERNAPRTLDLDLIAFGREVHVTPELEIPHPRARVRAFVTGPICDMDPRWRDPVTRVSAGELFRFATVGRDARPFAD